jgi:hypothetical protein
MAHDPVDIRRAAEDRVRLRCERQTGAQTESQRQECERDARLQSRAIADSVASQTVIELDKTLTLRSHDREWQQAKDRLAHRPIPAPAFDMMGGPSSRNLAQDYDEMQRRSTARRDLTVKEFDERIAGCAAARAEMQQGFARANDARDQGHAEDRMALANRQRESFERLVTKEVARADRWASREFKARSRDDNSNER